MILIIAAQDLRRLFLSPLAWVLLAIAQGLLAWIFLVLVDDFQNLQDRLGLLDNAPGITDLVAAPLLRVTAWVLLLLTPLLTMRLLSEERRSGVLDLLLSAPVTPVSIILGKYLGVLLFLLIMIMMAALMPLSLMVGAPLDLGKLLAGLLGLCLLAGGFAAVGLYLSMRTTQPILAGAATFGLLLLLWMIDVPRIDQQQADSLLSYLSLSRHYDALLLGWFDSTDVAYYLLFIATFLGLAIRRLDDIRLRS